MGNAIKKETIIVACSVLFITLAVIGVSYSYFSDIGENNNYKVVSDLTLKATFKSGDTIVGELPKLSDEEGLKLDGYSFSLLNTGNLDMLYKVLLVEDSSLTSNVMMSANYIKVSIDSNEPITLSNLVHSDGYVVTDGVVKKENTVGDVTAHNIKVWASKDATNTNAALKITINSEVATNVATDVISKLDSNDIYTDEFDNIRYYGIDPNNYITYNDELWRIVGVFNVERYDGLTETRLKIVRNESLININNKISDSYYFKDNIGSILNNTYANKNESIYLNNYLSDEALSLIDYAKWNYGVATSLNSGLEAYNNEINDVKDNYNRDIVSYDLVGLLSASDYFYAENNGNYLNNNSEYWLLNNSDDVDSNYIVSNNSITKASNMHYANVVPSVYLKSIVTITDGDGSINTPYVIK